MYISIYPANRPEVKKISQLKVAYLKQKKTL